MRINKPFLERGLDVDLVQRNKLFLCDRLGASFICSNRPARSRMLLRSDVETVGHVINHMLHSRLKTVCSRRYRKRGTCVRSVGLLEVNCSVCSFQGLTKSKSSETISCRILGASEKLAIHLARVCVNPGSSTGGLSSGR